MQENPSKADTLIEDGVDALRSERAPGHDPTTITSRLATRPSRTLATGTVAVLAIATAAIAFAPRESTAAHLEELGSALESLPPRQEVHLVATKNGQYEVELEIYVDNDEVVLQGDDQAKLTWKNHRLTTEFETYATVQDAKMPDWTTKTFLLSDWIRKAVPNTVERKKVKAADVLPQGEVHWNISIDPQLVLERVAFDVKLDARREGHVVFNVEPVTLRPVLVQASIVGERDVKVMLGYESLDLTATTTNSVETYDIDKQRQEIVDSFAAPIAVKDVEGTKILLHRAVIDHDGHLTLIYSGSEALPLSLDKSKIVAAQSDGPTLALMPQSYEDGLMHPVPYKLLQVSLVSVRLDKSEPKSEDVPLIALGRLLAQRQIETKDVQVPVVVKGTLHWVAFADVPLMRTGNSLMLLAPENVPFFTKKD